ncbi:MAG TPA: heme-binding domain-containing protein [Terracidiphilus sp.]|nr:heme-binding domain-containing protein [Terracidiphilus sp.]
MKRMRIALILAAAAVATSASLLLAQLHPFGNAGLFASGVASSAIQPDALPADVREILDAKCADCHSLHTRAPFYGHFAPVSWLLERDVVRARRAMNLSEWDGLTSDEQDNLKAMIAHEVSNRAMPPAQFLAIHWKAHLTDEDRNVLARWSGAQEGSASLHGDAIHGDANRGRLVFEKRCTGCHSLTQDREGPHLGDVYGRVSGTVPRFAYSDELKKAHIQWNETTLDHWLADPDALVPGNAMDFSVPRPEERADLIRFLELQRGR